MISWAGVCSQGLLEKVDKVRPWGCGRGGDPRLCLSYLILTAAPTQFTERWGTLPTISPPGVYGVGFEPHLFASGSQLSATGLSVGVHGSEHREPCFTERKRLPLTKGRLGSRTRLSDLKASHSLFLSSGLQLPPEIMSWDLPMKGQEKRLVSLHPGLGEEPPLSLYPKKEVSKQAMRLSRAGNWSPGSLINLAV